MMRDDRYLDPDAVFGVKESLVVPFVATDDPDRARELGVANPFYLAQHDFAPAPAPGTDSHGV